MSSISIIMPVRNRPKLTKQTVDTLFRNTNLPFKLIIVNDNSDDETNKYLETLKDKARVISMPESKGSGPCKNAGVSVAGNPDFYYFTDNDIYFLPNWLETLLAIMERFPKIGVCGGRTHQYHGRLDVLEEGGIRIITCLQQSGYSMLVRPEVWQKCGPFVHTKMPEGLGKVGVDFCHAVRNNGWEIARSIEPVVVHCGFRDTFGREMTSLVTEKQQIFPDDAITQE